MKLNSTSLQNEETIVVKRIYNPKQNDAREGMWELDLVERGVVLVDFETGTQTASVGAWVFASSCSSLWLRPAPNSVNVSILQVRFAKDYFPAELLNLPPCANVKAFLQMADCGLIGQTHFAQLLTATARLSHAQEWERVGALMRVVGLMASATPCVQISTLIKTPVAVSRQNSLVGKIETYMQEHLEGPLKLNELARIAGVTDASLSRYFRKQTGVTPFERLGQLRLQRACQLLETTDFPVKEVASRCGFTDSNFFYRLFRRKLHCTPSEFRARKR